MWRVWKREGTSHSRLQKTRDSLVPTDFYWIVDARGEQYPVCKCASCLFSVEERVLFCREAIVIEDGHILRAIVY